MRSLLRRLSGRAPLGAVAAGCLAVVGLAVGLSQANSPGGAAPKVLGEVLTATTCGATVVSQ